MGGAIPIRGGPRAGNALAREFGGGVELRKQLGARHRVLRRELDGLLAAPHSRDLRAVACARLDERDRAVRPLAEELRRRSDAQQLSVSVPDLVSSLAHMHVNRMLRSAQRAHEIVIYDLMRRHYLAKQHT